jgi:hypothetical protein
MPDLLFDILKECVIICSQSRIKYWVVGGFAFDAKRGYLSRIHGDIDLCVHHNDLEKCFKIFSKNGFEITKQGLKFVIYKSGIKIDIFELFPEGNYYLRKREWFNARYPREMFDSYQTLTLNGLTLRIPSNEGLRHYGSKTSHQKDLIFTENLPFNKNIYSKIEYKEFADYQESIKNIKAEKIIVHI